MSHRLPLQDIEFIADFAAYARGRGDEAYGFTSPWKCACAQFLRDTGRAVEPSVDADVWSDDSLPRGKWHEHPLPEGINHACNNGGRHRTFSALADRLEALIADQPTVVAA